MFSLFICKLTNFDIIFAKLCMYCTSQPQKTLQIKMYLELTNKVFKIVSILQKKNPEIIVQSEIHNEYYQYYQNHIY